MLERNEKRGRQQCCRGTSRSTGRRGVEAGTSQAASLMLLPFTSAHLPSNPLQLASSMLIAIAGQKESSKRLLHPPPLPSLLPFWLLVSHVDNSKFVFQSSNCLQNGIDFMQMSTKILSLSFSFFRSMRIASLACSRVNKCCMPLVERGT